MPPAVSPDDLSAHGLATGDRDALRKRILTAWDSFLGLAEQADLTQPSRLPGWTGRDVVAHLGAWETTPLARVLASARAGAAGRPPNADQDNARVLAAQAGASTTEVLAAGYRARDAVAEFLGSPAEDEWGLSPALAAVGPLPVLTIVHAGAYELAVHALDLAPCGAPAAPPELLLAGVAALVDVTGALAARTGRVAAATVQTPDGGWYGSAPVGPHGWRTEAVPPGPVSGPALFGTAADLLDASAGRVFVPQLLASRRIRLQEVGRLLTLTPILSEVPGIPGRAAMIIAARSLSTVSGALGRLGRLPGWPG
jgi:uncharacterized protein (TIGR03083 family)